MCSQNESISYKRDNSTERISILLKSIVARVEGEITLCVCLNVYERLNVYTALQQPTTLYSTLAKTMTCSKL